MNVKVLKFTSLCLAILAFVVVTKCQEKRHVTLHTDIIEQTDSGGFMFVQVTSKNGETIYYRREGKNEIQLSSMVWDKDSLIVDPTKVQFEGCYLLLYCKKHLVAYVLIRLECGRTDYPFKFVKK